MCVGRVIEPLSRAVVDGSLSALWFGAMEKTNFESELLIAPVGHMISVAELSQVCGARHVGRGVVGRAVPLSASLCSPPSLPPDLPVAPDDLRCSLSVAVWCA